MRTLAVIPARGGSKGLPGKNLQPLAGVPLIEHSIRLAGLCPEVDRLVVSTDSDEIAGVARAAGAEVPFIRPAALARDDTPMLPVLRHVLRELDPEGEAYDLLLLLDPTSPGRLPEDVARAHALLANDAEADGVVAVSEPSFNPIWHAVVESDGYMEQLLPAGRRYGRRQDLPRVLRINAALYLFRSSFLRGVHETWLDGCHLMLEIPDERAVHIDDRRDLELCELLVEAGRLRLPWLEEQARRGTL
jgi:N-acylneuraminate cytidylyltransferase